MIKTIFLFSKYHCFAFFDLEAKSGKRWFVELNNLVFLLLSTVLIIFLAIEPCQFIGSETLRKGGSFYSS